MTNNTLNPAPRSTLKKMSLLEEIAAEKANPTLVEEAVELKPCPFCGTDILTTPDDDGGTEYYHSGVSGGCILQGLHFEDDQLAAWNTRTLLAALPTDDDVERVARALCRLKANEGGIWFDDAALNKHIDNNWRSFKPEARAAIHTLIGRATNPAD